MTTSENNSLRSIQFMQPHLFDAILAQPENTVEDGVKRPENSEIAKIAEDTLNAVTYSIATVAASPNATFAPDSLEGEFKSAMRRLSTPQRSALQSSATALVRSDANVRQVVFGRYGNLAPQQVQQLGFARMDTVMPNLLLDSKLLGATPPSLRVNPSMLRPTNEGLLIPNELFNSQLETADFEAARNKIDIESERMTDIWGPMFNNDPFAQQESLEANNQLDKLGLYITRIKCVDETNPEIPFTDDDIALGGISVDEDGDTKQIARRKIGGFNDGDQKRYRPHWQYTWFNLREQHRFQGAKWPKRYGVSLILVEEDHGNFSAFLNNLWGRVRDRVKSEIAKAVAGGLSAKLGPILSKVIGQAVAWILDKLVNLLIRWFKDDIFRPMTLSCNVSSLRGRFTRNGRWGSTTSNILRSHVSGHGGRYYIEYYWRLFR